MTTFEIPDGPTTIDAPRSGNPKNPQPAISSAVYSVTNTTSDSVVGRLGVKVAGASKQEWFTVDGDRERTFDPNETQTATITVNFPPETAQGDYSFRLRAVAVNDPDNDHVEGPMTRAKLGPGGKGTTSWLWLWILLGVIALMAVGGGLYYAFGIDEPKDPVKAVTAAKPQSPTPAAPAKFDPMQAAQAKAIEWIDAYNARDVKTLVDLSKPPFIYGDELILWSEAQIRDAYAFNDPRFTKIRITDLTPQPISNVVGGQEDDRALQRLKLKRDDVAVLLKAHGGELTFLFRRSADNVQLAGVMGRVQEPVSEMGKIEVNAVNMAE